MSRIDEIHEELKSLLGYDCVIVKLETYNNDIDEFKKAVEGIKFQVERNDRQREAYFKQESQLLQAEKALQSIAEYPNTEMQSPEDLGYTYQTMAEEALQVIRGNGES